MSQEEPSKPGELMPTGGRDIAHRSRDLIARGLADLSHVGGPVPVPPAERDSSGLAVIDSITSTVTGMKLKLIPAGSFLMGSPESDSWADDNEKPQHRVRICRAFYMGTTVVTRGQYRVVTGENPSFFKGSDDLPVEYVSWLEAVRFCNALSVKDGLPAFYEIVSDSVSLSDWSGSGYRLPTEAEWEYACRAGSTTRYSFGDDASSLVEYSCFLININVQVCKKSQAVCQKEPNNWGLFDMHGNVAEWCWDVYGDYAPAQADDPHGPPEEPWLSARVFRGAGYLDDPPSARAAHRRAFTKTSRSNGLGFRVARVP